MGCSFLVLKKLFSSFTPSKFDTPTALTSYVRFVDFAVLYQIKPVKTAKTVSESEQSGTSSHSVRNRARKLILPNI